MYSIKTQEEKQVVDSDNREKPRALRRRIGWSNTRKLVAGLRSRPRDSVEEGTVA